MENERQGRGQLTDRIKEKSKELLGYEITTEQLRLLPYINHTMTNTHKLNPSKITQKEREFISKLRSEGHIEGGVGGMRITKNFWLIMNELLFLGYVDLFE